jgi:hypothetical protein
MKYTTKHQQRVHNYLFNRYDKNKEPPTTARIKKRFSSLMRDGDPINPVDVDRALKWLREAGLITENNEVAREKRGRGWTNKEVEKLKELVKDSELSASQIAAHFPGRSRGSIIGYCGRNGIKLPNSGRARPKKVKKGKIAATRPREGYKYRTEPEIVGQPPKIPGQEPIPFMDLKPYECRFCVEDHSTPATPTMKCCGAVVMERAAPNMKGSYCDFHYEISTSPAYVSPLRRG